MEIESGLLLTEMRHFNSLARNGKIELPFLSTILVFIYSPIRILQEQKTKKRESLRNISKGDIFWSRSQAHGTEWGHRAQKSCVF